MRFLLAAALAALVSPAAHAVTNEDYKAVVMLANIDAAAASDWGTCYGTMTVVEAGSTHTLNYRLVHLNGARELLLTAPDDAKGTRYRSADPAEVLVTLPAFGNRTRKLNPQAINQPFWGSLFSVADVLELPFGARWNPSHYNEYPGGRTIRLWSKDGPRATLPDLFLSTDDKSYWITQKRRIRMLPEEARSEIVQSCAQEAPPEYGGKP